MAYNDYDDDSFTAEDRKNMGQDRPRKNKAEMRKNKRMAATTADVTKPRNTSLGALEYGDSYSNYQADELPEVSDPQATLSSVLKDQHERYISNFRDYETALLGERNDTSLIDSVEGDVTAQSRIAQEVAKRNRERYGYQQTGAESMEASRSAQRGGALNLAGGLNNARLAQEDINQQLVGSLFNIGQGVYNSSTQGLTSAAGLQAQRNMAFSNAKTAYKTQSIGFLGNLGKTLASLI
jgi:hypothetical protein|tara:strand:- start:4499 stop:5212 length:714 start_codon:yes stop_codon:yes gene_type:complete